LRYCPDYRAKCPTAAPHFSWPAAVALYVRKKRLPTLSDPSAAFVGKITGPQLYVLGVLAAELFRSRERVDRIHVTQLEGIGPGGNLGDGVPIAFTRGRLMAVKLGLFW